ncbi:Sco-Spondin [Manis pentadactyla]|nr:Sco-Spondin [Manis pentadactyla]
MQNWRSQITVLVKEEGRSSCGRIVDGLWDPLSFWYHHYSKNMENCLAGEMLPESDSFSRLGPHAAETLSIHNYSVDSLILNIEIRTADVRCAHSGHLCFPNTQVVVQIA